MDFALNDDQKMLRESVARFVTKSYDFETRRKRAALGGFARECWNSFAEMGWLAVTIAEESGGAGFGPIEAAIIAEEFGRGLVLEPFVMCGLFPAALLARCQAGATRTELLGALGSGEQLFAVAHGEPALRGRVSPLGTIARRNADGSYRIDGHKSLAVGAPVADRLLVLAAAETAGGAGRLFVVDAAAPGLQLERYTLLDGTPAADVHFDGVRVPAEALLTGADDALVAAQAAIDETIVACCAELLGDMEDAIALTAEYIKTRKQFGVAIGSFQALQHRMADMAIELSQARASLHRALAALTEPRANDERSVIVSGCKAQIVRSAHFVTAQSIQLHGGYGITEEYKVGHHFRRLLILDPLLGDARHHLGRYAAWLQRGALDAAVADNTLETHV
jgi:alkylation response protein AidB-like acyl-CoA dehydrogenase